MQINTEKRGKYLLVNTSGRLDASWAEYVTTTFLDYIRNGEHHLLIDASEMAFLSSAGIRALVNIYKELMIVKGSFLIVNAPEFVDRTIRTTGFGIWLSEKMPPDVASAPSSPSETSPYEEDFFTLDPGATLELSVVRAWTGWNPVNVQAVRKLRFRNTSFALGIGCPATNTEDILNQSGEFMVVAGNVVYQPPEAKSHPDYLLPEKDYIPELSAIQALVCEGQMSHLFRFRPGEGKVAAGLSTLANRALEAAGSDIAAIVIMAEADGLTGAGIIRSPGRFDSNTEVKFPEMRDWLAFCGEKVWQGELAMIFGIVAKGTKATEIPLLKPMPSSPGLSGHLHAVVFPFQPLPNGKIDIHHQTEKLFNGPPPRALLHLIDDNRPTTGLGESTLVRGACWCSPLKAREENL
jgi:anti-anti-sigma factor